MFSPPFLSSLYNLVYEKLYRLEGKCDIEYNYLLKSLPKDFQGINSVNALLNTRKSWSGLEDEVFIQLHQVYLRFLLNFSFYIFHISFPSYLLIFIYQIVLLTILGSWWMFFWGKHWMSPSVPSLLITLTGFYVKVSLLTELLFLIMTLCLFMVRETHIHFHQ